MYCGKRILEWSPTAQQADRVALHLNNKYESDGRDPDSFAGVASCVGKHDRPWKRRPIFGTVRYMNTAGLERRFEMNAYLQRYGRPHHPEFAIQTALTGASAPVQAFSVPVGPESAPPPD